MPSAPQSLQDAIDDLLEVAYLCRKSNRQGERELNPLSPIGELGFLTKFFRRRKVKKMLPALQEKLKHLAEAADHQQHLHQDPDTFASESYDALDALGLVDVPILGRLIDIKLNARYEEIAMACDHVADELARVLRQHNMRTNSRIDTDAKLSGLHNPL